MNFKRFLTLSVLGLISLIIIVVSIVIFTLIGKLLIELEIIGQNNDSKSFTQKAYAQDVEDEYIAKDLKFEIVDSKALEQDEVDIVDDREQVVEIESSEVSINNEFRLIIPKIGVDHNVVENVDPTNKAIYAPIINGNIAHGKWTFLPNEASENGIGITYLFAHREGPYGFLNRLGEMQSGDVFQVLHKGTTYDYKMTNRYVVDPKEAHFYTSDSPTPLLRIQTCENGNKQRLIVDAELVSFR